MTDNGGKTGKLTKSFTRFPEQAGSVSTRLRCSGQHHEGDRCQATGRYGGA